MTNADKIRKMTDEELADWIDRQYNEERDDWDTIGCYSCTNYKTHHYPDDCGDCKYKDGILAWLKKETKSKSTTKNCSLCKETNCILSAESEPNEEGLKAFADLRFDLEHNQLDIELGILDKEHNVIEKTVKWSEKGIDVNNCPACGKLLPEVE